MQYVADICYTIQFITIKLCTKFQNPKSEVAEKVYRQTETDRQTNTITEKAKTIYPLYTSYRGYKYRFLAIVAQNL